MSSKLIRGEALTDEPAAWQAPVVQRPAPEEMGDPKAVLARLKEEAREQGYKEGHAAGVEAGQKQLTERAQVFDSIVQTLARPLDDLDHRVEDELIALVKAVVRQLVRREMAQEPGQLVAVIREGMAALPVASGEITVKLHPDDAAVVRESLDPDKDDRAWQIEADPTMDRGDCVIVSPASQVDGRLETRLGRAIAGLFDEQRQTQAQDGDD